MSIKVSTDRRFVAAQGLPIPEMQACAQSSESLLRRWNRTGRAFDDGAQSFDDQRLKSRLAGLRYTLRSRHDVLGKIKGSNHVMSAEVVGALVNAWPYVEWTRSM